MNQYRVFKIDKFSKIISKLLTKKQQEELNSFIEELKQGKIIGQPLSYEFFREKKIGDKRVYFLVYKDLKIIFLVNASNKKYQQETIDEIKLMFSDFKKEAQRIASTL
ncbi:MAG: hypothetical protein ACMXYD_01870 [Candidatus Woesearchaeota archaeon]